jgi:hypothetical protein
MKKLLALTATIAIGLLATSAVGGAAQDEAATDTEPVPATWVTGEIIPSHMRRRGVRGRRRCASGAGRLLHAADLGNERPTP